VTGPGMSPASPSTTWPRRGTHSYD
jgi:hypothetical protein